MKSEIMTQKQYNICQAIFTSNFFFFFFSAAQISLYPFLTLFYRHLGLNEVQTGILYSTRAFVHLFSAPLWAHCAKRFNRRRSVLIFAVFITIITNLSLTLVPVLHNESDSKCNISKYYNLSGSHLYKLSTSLIPNSVITLSPILIKVPNNSDLSKNVDFLPLNHNGNNEKLSGAPDDSLSLHYKTTFITVLTTTTAETELLKSDSVTPTNNVLKSSTISVSSDSSWNIIHKKEYSSNKMYNEGIRSPNHNTKFYSKHKSYNVPDTSFKKQLSDWNSDDYNSDSSQKHISHKLLMPDSIDYNMKNDRDYAEYFDNLMNENVMDNYINPVHFKRHLQFLPTLLSIDNKDESIKDTTLTNTQRTADISLSKMLFYDWKSLASMTFLVVLLIITVGEIFMSPVEKICSDAWYEYLDNIDENERYGSHKLFSSLARAVVAISVCAGVEYSYCKLWILFNPFLLHFYTFASLCAIVFFCSMCYPLPGLPSKSKPHRFEKSLKLICCDIHMILYIITMLLGGWLFASTEAFLFWYLQDKGGTEIIMGTAILVAALSEIFMYFFYPYLNGWISTNGIIIISLVCQSGKFLYYSFLWTPWALIPVEILQMFTHAALWRSVSFSTDQIPNPGLNRFVKMIYREIIWQTGMVFGGIVSGYIYNKYGASYLFRGYSIATIIWFIIFSIFVRFHPGAQRPKGYHSLTLRKRFEEDTDEEKDDWLEKALKSEEVTLFDAKKRKRNGYQNHIL